MNNMCQHYLQLGARQKAPGTARRANKRSVPFRSHDAYTVNGSVPGMFSVSPRQEIGTGLDQPLDVPSSSSSLPVVALPESSRPIRVEGVRIGPNRIVVVRGVHGNDDGGSGGDDDVIGKSKIGEGGTDHDICACFFFVCEIQRCWINQSVRLDLRTGSESVHSLRLLEEAVDFEHAVDRGFGPSSLLLDDSVHFLSEDGDVIGFGSQMIQGMRKGLKEREKAF